MHQSQTNLAHVKTARVGASDSPRWLQLCFGKTASSVRSCHERAGMAKRDKGKAKADSDDDLLDFDSEAEAAPKRKKVASAAPAGPALNKEVCLPLALPGSPRLMVWGSTEPEGCDMVHRRSDRPGRRRVATSDFRRTHPDVPLQRSERPLSALGCPRLNNFLQP